jgi:hypothetical protein
MYGSLENLGTGNAILILLQLVFAGVVVIMLDEMLQVNKYTSIFENHFEKFIFYFKLFVLLYKIRFEIYLKIIFFNIN